MVQINFDANKVKPDTGFTPLPEGWYNVAIAKSEMKPTKKGDGAYLQLDAKVIDGEHAGRNVAIRLNLQNPNQQAVDISEAELSAITHVTRGPVVVTDSSELHDIPFQIRVIVVGENNEVKNYKDAAGNEPGKAAPATGGPATFGGSHTPPPAQTPAQPPAAAPVMTPAANGTTYQQYVDAGWTEAQMIEGGFMVAPAAAAAGSPPPPPASGAATPPPAAGWTQGGNDPAGTGGAPWGQSTQ